MMEYIAATGILLIAITAFFLLVKTTKPNDHDKEIW